MNKNSSIKCSVTNCKHHSGNENYCTLNAINVGCCDSSVTCCKNTECASFDLASGTTTH